MGFAGHADLAGDVTRGKWVVSRDHHHLEERNV